MSIVLSNSLEILPYDLHKYIYNIALQEEDGTIKKNNLLSEISIINKVAFRVTKELIQESWDNFRNPESWNNLRNRQPPLKLISFIQYLMDGVELKEESKSNKESIYQESPRRLFKELERKFREHGAELHRPLLFLPMGDIKQHLEKMKKTHDETIIAIWPKINQALPEEFKNNNLKRQKDILAYIDRLAQTDKLTSVTDLFFERLSLKIIPDVLQCFPNLQHIDLSQNSIKIIPEFLFNLHNLKSIDLKCNGIFILSSSILKLPKETNISLQKNYITVIPARFFPNGDIASFDAFPKIDLYGNLLWIIRDKGIDPDFSSKDLEDEQYAKFKNYPCKSQLSLLCQFIALEYKYDNIKSVFSEIKSKDKELIFEAMSLVVREIFTDLNHDEFGGNLRNWAKKHTFDNRHIFSLSVRRAIQQKFGNLSKKEKNKVYERISLKANKEIDLKWGKEHAFDNILLLIDVMAEIEEEENNSSINCVIS